MKPHHIDFPWFPLTATARTGLPPTILKSGREMNLLARNVAQFTLLTPAGNPEATVNGYLNLVPNSRLLDA